MAARKTKKVEEEVSEETNASVTTDVVDEPYQALYRRFRPRRFEDVFGQEITTNALARSIEEKRTTHAYLFHGPRGCGKTTSARIFAAALNCSGEKKGGEPCGVCDNCVGILAGDPSFGVIEYDAATNRSIDGIRNIIEQAYTASPMSKYKVFIIDEVHALTKDAITAFLKTLEEPPASVVFILCTTDPDRVIPTVRSRTTSFRFNLVEAETMTNLVRGVVEQAKIEATDKQIRVAVYQGKGSPRDTLSALERIALGTDDDVIEYGLEISEAIIEASVSKVIIKVAEAASQGTDPQSLGSEVLAYWRDCVIALEAPNLLNIPDSAYDELVRIGKGMKLQRLFRSIQMLADTVGKMGYSGDPRLALETSLLQIILPDTETRSSFAISEQLEDISEAIQDIQKRLDGAPARPASSDPWSDPSDSAKDNEAVWPPEEDSPEEPEPDRRSDKDSQKTSEPDESEASSNTDSDIDGNSSDEDVLEWLLNHPDLTKRDKVALRDVQVDRDTTDARLVLSGTKDISDSLYDQLTDLVKGATGRKFKYYDD